MLSALSSPLSQAQISTIRAGVNAQRLIDTARAFSGNP